MIFQLKRTEKVAYAAMLLTLYVVLTRLVGLFQPAPIFSFNRLGFGIPLIIFSSIVLGPFYGALVGVAGDALGWVLLGSWTGPFNVFISVFYAIVGIAPYFLLKGFGQAFGGRFSLIAFAATFASMLIAFLLLLWVGQVFDARFIVWGVDVLIAKIVLTCLAVVLTSGTLVGLYFLSKKEIDHGTLGRIVWLCFVIEVMTIFLKPLAFYAYCSVFVGQDISVAWGIDYGMLALLCFLFSFADIAINVLSLRLFLFVLRRVAPKVESHG